MFNEQPTKFKVLPNGLWHHPNYRQQIDPTVRPYLNGDHTNQKPASFLVPEEFYEQALKLTDQFFLKVRPDWLIEFAETPIYSDLLSPTGTNPPTHRFCFFLNMTDRYWEEVNDFRSECTVPLPAEWRWDRWPVGTTKQGVLNLLGLKLIK